MNRNIKITDRLSFSFGVLFVLLMVIMPLTAGIYSYNKTISDFTEHNTDTLKHISALLKTDTSTKGNSDDFLHHAEILIKEFELSSISCVVTSADNSKIKCIAEATYPDDSADIYHNSYADYYKNVSPEITQLISEIYEYGSVVSNSNILNGEYGEDLTCYTSVVFSNNETGILCVGMKTATQKRQAFFDALIIALIIEAVVLIIGIIYMRHIGNHCTMRLRRLSESIGEYARIKDPIIAEHIRQNENGNDEIAVLSQQTASMISELQTHISKIMDISSELLSANEQAEKFSKLAHIDALTGLENKMSYYETVTRLDNQINSGTAEFAFIVIDLNYLKRINDECGHNHGDTMIKKLASLIKDFFHDCSSFRIGGDEFAVIIEGEMSQKALTLVAKFQQLLEEGSIIGYKKFPSAAVGCANYRVGIDTNAKEVFDRADNEMYGNKIQMKAVRRD